MLTHIYIKNYTIVKSLNLDLQDGLNVLTGETGAGKSIIVDAVSLALGARADANAIYPDENSCDISLCFDISNHPPAKRWLQEQQFDSEEECIIRRSLNRDGRSRSTINGHPCTLYLTREFGELILNIHSQHQHQSLLKREMQQLQLDTFAHHEEVLMKINQLHQQWQKISKELATLKQRNEDRNHQLELLQYQLEELNALNLQENEWHHLTQQHQQLHNAKDLIDNLNQAIALTMQNENTSASLLLQQAIDRINEIKTEDPPLTAIKELLNSAAIHLQEAGEELSHYRDHLDLSPENLTTIEQRITTIHDLARKHHVNPADLSDVKKSLAQEIKTLENIETQLIELQRFRSQILDQYQTIANQLSQSRLKAAKILEKQITQQMQRLNIHGGQFKVQLQKTEEIITPYGNEKIIFMVCTNPGQGFLPLQKVVSGGELSRISLALQVITAQKEGKPTLIFDEVDTGIGGKTAEIVGQLLRELGEKVQVLCITHLPQVSAQGHHHFKIEKTIDKKSVSTTIYPLNKKERIDELARMLSGSKITEQMLAHAEKMLI